MLNHPKKESKELECFLKTISVCMFQAQSCIWLRHSQKIHLGSTPRQSACPSVPQHLHPHSQPSTLSAGDLEMGAEACSPVWRPVLAKTHTFGLPGSLWTPDWAQSYQSASWSSAAFSASTSDRLILNGRKCLSEKQTFSLSPKERFTQEARLFPGALNKERCHTATALKRHWRG